MTAKNTPPAPTKKVSPAVTAARAFNRYEALIVERDAELANAPESITQRYAKKMADVANALTGEAAELLHGMLTARNEREARKAAAQ